MLWLFSAGEPQLCGCMTWGDPSAVPSPFGILVKMMMSGGHGCGTDMCIRCNFVLMLLLGRFVIRYASGVGPCGALNFNLAPLAGHCECTVAAYLTRSPLRLKPITKAQCCIRQRCKLFWGKVDSLQARCPGVDILHCGW